MRLAVVADIHGNVLALEAVLADIARRGADLSVNLGDCISGPLWPRETYDVLKRLALPTVRGNHDRVLCDPIDGLGPSDHFAATELMAARQPGSWERLAVAEMTTASLRELATLPATLTPVDGVLACHGTPDDDMEYLLETTFDGIMIPSTAASISKRLQSIREPLVLCGHSHLPRVVQNDGSLIVNPGSVGCPAYEDPGDPCHVSEAGSPHARYAVLDDHSGAWTVDLIAVAYDWARAAERARENGRPEWAMALSTGRVR